jgi:predicted DNA-binding transcriptional regulator AlpA
MQNITHEAPGVAFLLSDNAAAAWLGISRATFWRRVGDGTFPQPVRIVGRTLWRRDELLAAVDRAAAGNGGAK